MGALIAFYPAVGNSFTNWDDPAYILSNKYISSLSFENIKNIFKIFYDGNYHPLAILSTAVEYHFAGFKPEVYHTTNVIIHLLNTFLVFRFVYLLSKKNEIAFITSLLFGIHPMHVESVAWIAERKDVLYTFFFFASLVCYVTYLKNSFHKKYYLFSILLFILSLLSKGQAVMLSVVIVLTDFLQERKLSDKKVILEKIPFFLLSAIFGIVAIFAQRSLGAVNEIHLTVFKSFFFGWYGLLIYIVKAFIPIHLSAFYSYPFNPDGSVPLYIYLSPALFLALIFFFWKKLKHNRVAIFGTVFFLAVIFPVLQFLPIGKVMLAERYTYIPYVGIFFMIGHLFLYIKNEEAKWTSNYKKYLNYIAGAYCIFLFSTTWQRCKVWHDSMSLWNDVLVKDDKCKMAYKNRSTEYCHNQQFENALTDCNKRIQLDTNIADAYNSRGFVYNSLQQYDRGLADLNKAYSLDSRNPEIFLNRGVSYYHTERYNEAAEDFRHAIALDSNNINIYNNLGLVYTDHLNLFEDAVIIFKRALKIDSLNLDINTNFGVALYKKGNYIEAMARLSKSLELSPENAKIYYVRSLANDFGEALNSGACLSSLCRTRIGEYKLDEAWQINDFAKFVRGEK